MIEEQNKKVELKEMEEESIVVSVPESEHNINSYLVWG